MAQQAVSHHFVAGAPGGREFTTPFRYVWPSELDLMARLAGMVLRHRWAGWDRAEFTGESTSHVSVWQGREHEADVRTNGNPAAVIAPAAPGWRRAGRRPGTPMANPVPTAAV